MTSLRPCYIPSMYVAIDLGGTRCRVLTTHSLDDPQMVDRHEFVLSHVFEHDMQALIATIRQYTTGEKIAGIGFSVPGDLNPEKTTFADPSDNLLEWSDKPVKATLEHEFNCRVILENDGSAAALGEAYFGLGKGKDFTFIIWGTGIGGAEVKHIDGHVQCTTLDWYHYLETWEDKCGGNKIRQLYGTEAKDLSETDWQQVMSDFRAELAVFCKASGAKSIIFGGGIAIKQQSRIVSLSTQFKDLSIQVSHLGEDVGLYGALTLLRNQS